MDPKQVSTKRSGQALGWPHQKLIPRVQGKVQVRLGAQTPWKVGKERFEAVHSQKVSIRSLK